MDCNVERMEDHKAYIEGKMKVVHGKLTELPETIRRFVETYHCLMSPDSVHICDGSEEERVELYDVLLSTGTIVPLKKMPSCYLARTNPEDVARVESKTFMCTSSEGESVTIPRAGCTQRIGLWADQDKMRFHLKETLKGCMKGRVMYVLPFCMGTLGSPLSRMGLQLTDSAYVVASMRIMTTVGAAVLERIVGDEFVKCVHSVGLPVVPGCEVKEVDRRWPCNPAKTVITQFPDTNEVISFGSGYGGNSLLGKKCFALRIASNLALKEGWLAEHMLIMGLEDPQHNKIYVAAAFPSACGKTNLAMMKPSLPGWKVTCVGDDISWLKFDEQGVLRAVNPEKGFFGVCPGTSYKTNPSAMDCMKKNTIFTNVCETSDGGVFWEGLEEETDMKGLKFVDWQLNEWDPSKKTKAAHPNSRFCSPITNCPILDQAWDHPDGVPISAIIFGGRRPTGIPLVYQSLSWNHGVLLGASLKSETTAAASDVKQKVIVNDPFAMRPFFGYNFGRYMQHWVDVGSVEARKLPKIFHVNWFLKDKAGNFIWPGFSENSRVLKWIHERCSGAQNFVETCIGNIPTKEHFDTSGLKDVKHEELFRICPDFWSKEVAELREFFESVVNKDFPDAVRSQLDELEKRVTKASQDSKKD